MLSIVIVNYNVKYFLEQCLTAVIEASKKMDVEIFVVDNASTDGSKEYISQRFPKIKYIVNEQNIGFAAANNVALNQCTGKYVLLLNPDTVIGESVLKEIYSFMETHADAGAAGVKMIDYRGIFLPESKRSFPTPWASFCKLFGLSKAFPESRLFARYNLLYLFQEEEHKVDVLSGAFMFIRREALDKAGLLDESFFMYGEDIDLSYRIVLSGYRNYYIPTPILHYKGESSKKGDLEYIKNFYGAMLIFYRKYYHASSFLLSFPIRQAIKFKTKQAIKKTAIYRTKNPSFMKPVMGRKVLIICREDVCPILKKVCKENIPSIEILEWERAPGIHHFKLYTDIVYCFPDMSFEQMLNRMYAGSDGETVYHIYNNISKQIITSTRYVYA